MLPCLQLRRCEVVVAVERAVFDRWVAAAEPVKLVTQSRAVPGLSVALREGTKPGAEALAGALSEALTATGGGRPGPLAAADFEYVSTLGYFTPRTLPGAQVVDAAAVARLLLAGAVYVDTRTGQRFRWSAPFGRRACAEAGAAAVPENCANALLRKPCKPIADTPNFSRRSALSRATSSRAARVAPT